MCICIDHCGFLHLYENNKYWTDDIAKNPHAINLFNGHCVKVHLKTSNKKTSTHANSLISLHIIKNTYTYRYPLTQTHTRTHVGNDTIIKYILHEAVIILMRWIRKKCIVHTHTLLIFTFEGDPGMYNLKFHWPWKKLDCETTFK